MRFLFAVPTYHPNLFEIAAALQARQHEVHFATHRGGGSRRGYSYAEPQVLGKRPRLRTIWRTWRDIDPDVVILRSPQGAWRAFGALAKLFGRASLSYNLRSFAHSANLAPAQRLRRVLRPQPKVHITPVFDRGTSGRAKVKPHSYYLPFPATQRVDSQRSYVPEGTVRIMAVGKLHQPRKRLDLLVRAAASLCREVPIHLTLVGTAKPDKPAYQKLTALIDELGIADRVTLRANLRQPEVLGLYAQHDLFVLPADKEPLGISVLEAMAGGCAVVTGHRTGAKHWIQPGHNGAIFETNSQADLERQLAPLLRDPDRLARAGRASLRLVAQRHSHQLFHDSLMALIAQRFPRQAPAAVAAHGTAAVADG